MKPLLAFIASTVILAALVLAFPHVLLNPGPLMQGHQGFRKDCLRCHKPLGGAGALQCISCHKPADIGVRNVAGDFLAVDSSKVLFHGGLDNASCSACHTDHRGIGAKKALRTFRHESVAPTLRRDCISCHRNRKPNDLLHRSAQGNCADCHGMKKWKPAMFVHDKLQADLSKNCTACHKAERPNDNVHVNMTVSCGECHGTKGWKPATFDHSRVSGATGKQCISCHKADRPSDGLHIGSQASCATCHSTRRWTPSTFDHSRYFRLDGDHRASCRTCHTDPAKYKTYTCYNCHEHSPASIASEHREEGIANYRNCVRCHRDGSEGGGYRERGGSGDGDD